MTEFVPINDHDAFVRGFIAAIRDARKEVLEIERLKKPFNLRTVDTALKDLIKNLRKEYQDEQAEGQS